VAGQLGDVNRKPAAALSSTPAAFPHDRVLEGEIMPLPRTGDETTSTPIDRDGPVLENPRVGLDARDTPPRETSRRLYSDQPG